ncbi:hypothetical protein HDV00_012438 [Rhizophlyctis rosea]|nr:hypothetical protein HDV00_012438 [Rhizophlyctis rosea]
MMKYTFNGYRVRTGKSCAESPARRDVVVDDDDADVNTVSAESDTDPPSPTLTPIPDVDSDDDTPWNEDEDGSVADDCEMRESVEHTYGPGILTLSHASDGEWATTHVQTGQRAHQSSTTSPQTTLSSSAVLPHIEHIPLTTAEHETLEELAEDRQFLRNRNIVGGIIQEQVKKNEEAQDIILASQFDEEQRLCERAKEMARREAKKVAVLRERKEAIGRKVAWLREQKAIREQILELTQEAGELEKEELERQMEEA